VVSSLKKLSDAAAVANRGKEEVREAILPPPEAASLQSGVAAASVRVPVGVLDRLMNLVGELVLARNQVHHTAMAYGDAGLTEAVQRLKSVTSSLQVSVMKARMQPIGSLWKQMPRLVRDMAAQFGKQVVVEMKGQEIELDRSILEAIKDPLTHILRNAIHHGIESPEERTRAGKTAAGHVRLNAFHEGGRVYVEISDDGAGINLARVRQRAVEQGLIAAKRATGMNQEELCRLVFAAGFSTAETVTNISGRGVGLDVVRTNIEKIGGVTDLRSVSGEGTTLRINLPLTLAILPALMVGSGGERFAIPQVNLLELVRLDLEHQPGAMEEIYGAPVYRMRDRLLPLVFLDHVLQLPRRHAAAMHIVVLRAGARTFGLVVDAISDAEEIVVKPLSKQLKGLGCFAGAAVLGDGGIVLILDVVGLAHLASLATAALPEGGEGPAAADASATVASQRWVTFRGMAGTRFALPLSAVARLEEIPAESIERSCGGNVMQYHGEILSLLGISDLFHEPQSERDVLSVLVLRQEEKRLGLVVDGIEDIVEEAVKLRSGEKSDLVQGTAVIRERVADVLDPEGLFALAGAPVVPAAGSR
jgi:two-component system chemotaxis sensor kinase CheA